MVKGIWNGESNEQSLISGKEYEIVDTDFGGKFVCAIDETGDDYLYPTEDFTITQGQEELDQMIEKDKLQMQAMKAQSDMKKQIAV